MHVTVEIRDKRFNQVVGPEPSLERVATGFAFLEGPIWHPRERCLIFSDILGDRIYRWSEEEGAKVFRQPSQMANGNTFDRQGRLLTCEHATSRVVRSVGVGGVEVVASHYEGQELNSPNDIVVRGDGSVYFTDPNSGRGARYGVARPQELPFQGVYRLVPDDGALTLLADDFSKPNGLCFSPDESLLYVNDTDQAHIRVFDMQADGTVGGGRVWADLEGQGPGVADGMKVDRDGHLYCAGPGGIHLFDASGLCLGVIQMPEYTTNLAWGEDDMRSLYVTASTSVYRIRVMVEGEPGYWPMDCKC
jgi:gluconolactonase